MLDLLRALQSALQKLVNPKRSRCPAQNGRYRCELDAGHEGGHRCWIDRGFNGPKYYMNWEDEIRE